MGMCTKKKKYTHAYIHIYTYTHYFIYVIIPRSLYYSYFSFTDEESEAQAAAAAAAAKSFQSCPTLCDPIEGSPPGSPALGILQARTLEWVAISFSDALKWKVKVKFLSRVQPSATPWTAAYQAPPSIHGIFQARVLEWVATAFSGGSGSFLKAKSLGQKLSHGKPGTKIQAWLLKCC